jgi:hypothetical protein
MVFKLTVAANAREVRHESVAAASLALKGCHWGVFLVGMFARTTRPPSVDIESFASGKPPLSKLLRTPWDKPEEFTRACLAVCLKFPLRELLCMTLEEVTAETLRFSSNAEAVFLGRIADPSYVDARRDSLIGVIELPCQHFLCAWSGPDLGHQLHNLTFACRLHH